MARITRRRLLALGGGLGATVVLASCGAAATPTAAPAKPTEAPKPAAPAAAATTAPAAAPTTAAPAAAAASPTTAAAAAPAAKPTEAAKPAAQPAAAGKVGTEFEVAVRIGGDAENMPRYLEKFNQQTGHKGKLAAYPAEPEYQAKVLALHATKQVADVIWASVCCIHFFASKGALAELDPVIAGDKYPIEDYPKNGLDTMKLNGKLYGMPWGAHPGNGGFLYNVDLLNKAGLNVTDDCASFDNVTWDQLLDASKKVRAGDVYGWNPGTDFLSITNFVNSFGGDFLTPDGKALAMDTPEFKKGLGLMHDIFAVSKVAPTPDPKLNAGEMFANGKLALVHTGYPGQFVPGEKAIAGKFKWNVGMTPKGPAGKRGTSLTINGQTISATTTKKEVAWEYVKFLMDPEQNVDIVMTNGGRPAVRKSVLYHEKLMKEMKAHKCFVPSIEASEPWKQPANLRWTEFNATVSQVFADLWLGKVDVDKAIAEAKPKLQAIVDKPLP